MNGFVFVPNAPAQNNGSLSVFNRDRRGGPASNFTSGDTLAATLLSRENGSVSLRTEDDFTFTVPSDSVKGEIGDTLHFKVVRRDSSGLALRQVFPEIFAAIARGNAGIEDVGHVAKSLEQMNEEDKYRTEAHTEQSAKAAQAVAAVRRSQRAIAGNSTQAAIAAIAASGLDLNKVSFFTLNNIVQEIDAMPEIYPVMDSKSESNLDSNPGSNPGSNLGSNLEIKTLPDPAVAYLIKSGKEINQETIYAARYSTASEVPVKFEMWDTLDKQIKKIFKREGIEDTPKNLEAAKFLVAYDLPINRQNVENAIMLRNVDLVPTAIDTAQKVPYIKPQDVKTVLEAGHPLDLKNLIDASENKIKPEKQIYVPEKNLITAHRQLVELQWHMTVQAAIRLAHKGIKIDTEPLQQLVMHLRALETEGHTKALRVMGADTQSAPQMEHIFRTIEEMRPSVFHIKAEIQAKVMTQKADFTLAGVHKAVMAYEANATAPSSRYGDSFDKVTDQFKPLLARLGIAPTSENIRAASILSRNEIDVAVPAIEAIKSIDAKIAAVMDKLTPMIAAQMLKEGRKPLDMHMDEVLTYIRKFEDKRGFSGRDKIAQYILEMDRSKVLTPEERTGMIDVYRMLNLIQKNGAAALGLALKKDVPLTLGGLMEAAKYYDRHKQEMNEAMAKQPEAPATYTDLLADAVTDKGSPSVLKEWLPEDKPLEDALQQAIKASSFEPDVEQATQAIKQFTEAPPALIIMLQNAGILPTPDNIKAARKQSENSLIEALKDAEFDENLLELLAGGADRKDAIGKLRDALEDALPTEAVREAKSLLDVRYAMADDDENAFEIPVPLNGKFSTLRLYTLNEEAVTDGTARTFLSLNTDSLGNVQSLFAMEDGKINLQFAVDGPMARIQLEANQDILVEMLQEAGYDIGKLTFSYTTPIQQPEDKHIPQGKDKHIDPEDQPVSAPLDASDYEFRV